MKTPMRLRDTVEAVLERAGDVRHGLKLSSRWKWEQWRPAGRSGAFYLVDEWEDGNMVVDEGITYALDAALSGGTQKTAWYVAIFSDNHTPAAGDTYASPGYTESSAYTETTRPQWQEAGVSSKQITNSANKASFSMNATVTIYGAALVSDSTKGDTAASGAVLFNESKFSTSKPCESGDVLKVTVTITGSNV